MIYNDEKIVEWSLGVLLFLFMHFLPPINRLTLRCFVAEVMWLFPVNRQKYRESRKQWNTALWWELWARTLRLLKSVLLALQLKSRYFKVNLIFLFIVSLFLFCFVFFSFYYNFFATSSYSLILFPGAGSEQTEQGAKDELSEHKWHRFLLKQKSFHSYASTWLSFVRLTVFDPFPSQSLDLLSAPKF